MVNSLRIVVKLSDGESMTIVFIIIIQQQCVNGGQILTCQCFTTYSR